MTAPTPGLPGLMVVGTDTGVGKTAVSATLARIWTGAGHRVGVLKPVATGITRDPATGAWHSDDVEALRTAIGGTVPPERVAPLVYDDPLAPPVAARRAGTLLTWDHFARAVRDAIAWWAAEGRAETLLVEGVGGLLCPLTEGTTVADLAIALDFPTLVVARRGLGTLNHTLLTVEAAHRRGLRLAGVILNGAEPTADPLAEQTNAAELARRLAPFRVPVLGEWPHTAGATLPNLADSVVAEVATWYDRAQRSRSVDPDQPWRIGRPEP